MSARAAWRLESLSFNQVFRYTPGKVDWFASGLPREGKSANVPHAGDLARRYVPTCRLTDRVADVRQLMETTGWDVCAVVNDERVVLGLLRREALDAAPPTPVEQVMEDGPTAYRPSMSLEAIVEYMRKQGSDDILITTSDGELIGILYRQDAESRMADVQAATSGES